jgi:hypothetical protein
MNKSKKELVKYRLERAVEPYFEPVKNFIEKISVLIQSNFDKTP